MPEVYEAVFDPDDPCGVVYRRGAALSDEEAVDLLKAQGNIVVCGKFQSENKPKARDLMVAAYGGASPPERHDRVGPAALDHFHPTGYNPMHVHAFYESPPRRARKETP